MKHVRPPTSYDVWHVASLMREADKEECRAGGLAPFPALRDSVKHSIVSLTMVKPNSVLPAGILGVGPGFSPSWGAIWLLGTDAIAKHPMTFLRHSKPVLDWLYEHTGKEAFYNYTWVGNDLHHTWLRWLGFKFLRKVHYRNGEFYEFCRLKG